MYRIYFVNLLRYSPYESADLADAKRYVANYSFEARIELNGVTVATWGVFSGWTYYSK